MSEVPGVNKRIEKPVFVKLMQDVKVLSNISFILDKMDRDGHLQIMRTALETIFNKEINFAVTELSKLQKKTNNFDMKTHLTNNSFIFKENLKCIMEFMGIIISRSDLERKN